MPKKKNKVLYIIVSIICTLLIVCIFLDCFFPSFHREVHRGIDYYSNGSYKKMGHGFNRYGEIASKYLPEYDKISNDATYIDFVYVDDNLFWIRSVAVCIGARYPEEIYELKRDELLKQGKDIGQTVSYGNELDDTQCRLVEEKKRLNGEYMYYVTECSDMDQSIMHMVYFSSLKYDNHSFLMHEIMDEHSFVASTKFWRELHPNLYEKVKDYLSNYMVDRDA